MRQLSALAVAKYERIAFLILERSDEPRGLRDRPGGWDAKTGKPLGEALQHQNLVMSAAFNHDGTRVVTASDDKTARVWDAATGKPLAPPLQHQRPVWSAAFNHDGTRVVTASEDKTARVWETELDKTPCAAWPALAARSPFVLNGSTHVLRGSLTGGDPEPLATRCP